jgi:hypothetical protein
MKPEPYLKTRCLLIIMTPIIQPPSIVILSLENPDRADC